MEGIITMQEIFLFEQFGISEQGGEDGAISCYGNPSQVPF
jgi:hypothetical protein